jgi:hypothetical protein
VLIKPKIRKVISISPYTPIEPNEDGTGGGITCRMYGESGEPVFIEIKWGESTEIEIAGGV